MKSNVQSKTVEFIIFPSALPLSNSNPYQHPPKHHPISLITIRWVPTIYRHYSRCFHKNAWLSGCYHFWLSQHFSARLECTLEVFSRAVISRRSHSILLGFLGVSLIFSIVININLGFLEQTLWTPWTFASYSNILVPILLLENLSSTHISPVSHIICFPPLFLTSLL